MYRIDEALDFVAGRLPADTQARVTFDEVELMLQVNGKLRGSISVPATASKEDIEQAALASVAFQKLAQGAAPKKVVVVPGRLVNLVV